MKKLIVMLLAVAFVCASAVGCGDTKPTGSTTKAPAPGGAPGGGPGDKK